MSQAIPSSKRDDPSISDSENLLRRINPDYHIVPDGKGGMRLSTAAFSNSHGTDEMSVNISSKLTSPTDTLKSYPNFYLVSFTALTARELHQGVIPDPSPQDSSHGEVCGNKTKSIQKKFIEKSKWIKSPPSHSTLKEIFFNFLRQIRSIFRA